VRSPNRIAPLVACLIAPLFAGVVDTAQAADTYSPYAGVEHPTRGLWGDTHLHTTNSFDARSLGVTLDAEAAYRFARGEELTASSGLRVRLSRPLDFLVVTDHSDAMGAVDELFKGNEKLMADPELRAAREKILKGGMDAAEGFLTLSAGLIDGDASSALLSTEIMSTVWDRHVETADRFNDPGRFTAVIGYEWTPTRSGDKLHRNVLYRGDAASARRPLPFTSIESPNPQDLWKWMERYEEETGGRLLALAHNGNLSNGKMFPVETSPDTGLAIDADYVETRNKWEPLYEVTQIKGDGETHPYLSPDDEFADFETWDKGNVTLEVLKTPDMLQYEYARAALKNGLALERKLGTNPYRFGMVGSTDSHTALSTAEEDNFFGKFAANEPVTNRAAEEPSLVIGGRALWQTWETSASGYAAVWATENTREAIFDAMQRREVYATTGPRMTVRFFGGFDFDETDAHPRRLVTNGYAKGVPMGGILEGADDGGAPSFLVAAQKDPLSGNLDRIQIVKGWLAEDGETKEEVYDVVWGDAHRRKIGWRGRLDPVGSTVDVENATWTNTIGDGELVALWSDPDFDPAQPSFYYVRVIEIPTPRWTAYDAKFYGDSLEDDVLAEIQERAYTSPIWYQPE